jgi:prepilin-type N-terminal cleavage/methylation domain-containing protein/prepilin-type processing-associated H-X9-DG protein
MMCAGSSSRGCSGARTAGKRRGTTLIELLVVISVIALLATMLLPSMKRSVQMARQTVCTSNLRQIGTSLGMYRMENAGWLPPVRLPSPTASAGRTSDVWFLKLFPTYVSEPRIFVCPEDPYGYRMQRAWTSTGDPNLADYASFGMNSFILTAAGGTLAQVDRFQFRQDATILVADLGPDYGNSSAEVPGGTVTGPLRNRSLLSWDDNFDIFGEGEPWLTARHGAGINILTVDGHVAPVRTVDMLREPILNFYDDCARGNCTLCNHLGLYHYSFARDQVYWWLGPPPAGTVTGRGN